MSLRRTFWTVAAARLVRHLQVVAGLPGRRHCRRMRSSTPRRFRQKRLLTLRLPWGAYLITWHAFKKNKAALLNRLQTTGHHRQVQDGVARLLAVAGCPWEVAASHQNVSVQFFVARRLEFGRFQLRMNLTVGKLERSPFDHTVIQKLKMEVIELLEPCDFLTVHGTGRLRRTADSWSCYSTQPRIQQFRSVRSREAGPGARLPR